MATETVYSFVSQDGKGFTSDPSQALEVEGHKVLAPGVTRHISTTYIARQQMIWDLLLDVMEELFSIEAVPEFQGGRDMLIKKIEGIRECLALLNYGNTDAQSILLIKARADLEYDSGTEGGS